MYERIVFIFNVYRKPVWLFAYYTHTHKYITGIKWYWVDSLCFNQIYYIDNENNAIYFKYWARL